MVTEAIHRPAPGDLHLDAKDEMLLRVLQNNARASVVELARHIGLSRTATQERVARLNRSGAISQYTIVRGAGACGPKIKAWLFVRPAERSHPRITARLRGLPHVAAAYTLAGESELLVEVVTRDVEELDALRRDIGAIPDVLSVRLHVVLATHFERGG